MSTTRQTWLIVCSIFTALWLLVTLFTLGLAAPFLILSALCFLLPVGKEARPTPETVKARAAAWEQTRRNRS